jgi:DNA polymerase III subunit delta
MPAAKPFTFICGQDDYLVDRLARKRFAAFTGESADALSGEIISGFAANVGEVAAAVNRFREAVQTLPMFGGKNTAWMKDVNFLTETVVGKAESTLALLEDLKAILQNVNPENTAILISAAPVDRRRSFYKWCEQNADFVLADGGDGGSEALPELVLTEARALGATFAPGALELLLARIGPNSRLLVEETRKLANYASQPQSAEAPAKEDQSADLSPMALAKADLSAEASAKAETPAHFDRTSSGSGSRSALIRESDVAQLTPNAAEGDFFETAEAFSSGDLPWTLAALRRHFFAGGDARPVIAALQNRNRLLIQIRALLDATTVRVGPRGLDGLSGAAGIYRAKFGEAAETKSAYNIFSQNPWYLGKLAGGAKRPSLRRLIDNQMEFIAAFDKIARRPDEQEEILSDMAVRCLT